MMETAKKTGVVCSVILAFIAVLYVVHLAQMVLLYLLVAILFAIAIEPLVVKLKKLKLSRVLAATISIVFLLIIIFGILGIVIRPLVQQGVELAQNLPAITESLSTNPTFVVWNAKYHFADNLGELSEQASKVLSGSSSSLLFIATNVVTVISTIVIILVLTFLLLIQGDQLWKNLLSFLSDRNEKIAERIGDKIMKAISGFVSGNLLISLIAGIVTFITLWILGVPYMFALAVLVALLDLIPIVGAAIATIAVGLVALTKSILVAVVVVTVLFIYQFIETHVLQPMIYSRAISLSPLFIVVASFAGAEIAGIVGMLLAIPLAAVVQILATELYEFLEKVEN